MNKNVIWGLIVTALLVGGFIGYAVEKQRATANLESTKMAMQKQIDEAKMMAKDKAMDGGKDEAMMGIGYIMKDGKMMTDDNGKFSPMTQDVTLKDGTVVKTTGEVDKKDGTTVKLTEGQSIWPDGSILEAGKMSGENNKMQETSFSGKVLAGKSSPFLRYSKADYDKAKAAGKIIFLDFYANWCPICRAEAPDLQAGFNSLTTDKVVGFRVDWEDSDTTDEDKQITKDFTVVHQTTKIILKDGKEVARTQDQWDKDTFLQQINAAVGQ